MKKNAIIFCSLVLASSTAFAQKSALNAEKSGSDPVKQGVQKLQQAQQFSDPADAVIATPVDSRPNLATGTVIDKIEGAVKQKPGQGPVYLLN